MTDGRIMKFIISVIDEILKIVFIFALAAWFPGSVIWGASLVDGIESTWVKGLAYMLCLGITYRTWCILMRLGLEQEVN